MAREIVVDSYKGLLLWSTGHSIEMSRLNGYAHGVLHQNGLFSGESLTVRRLGVGNRSTNFSLVFDQVNKLWG